MAYENQNKCEGCGISIPAVREGADVDARMYAGLGVRAANVLYNNGLFRKADVSAALADGRLRPGKVRGYGTATDAELRRWASA